MLAQRGLGLLGEALGRHESRKQALGCRPLLALQRLAEDLDFAGSKAQEHYASDDTGNGDLRHGHELIDAELLAHDEVVFARQYYAAQHLFMSIEDVHSELDLSLIHI